MALSCLYGTMRRVRASGGAMEANTALIAARSAQPSRSRPSRPLSRKELAELVNRHIWDHHRQRTPVDENYIGKLERGAVRWPSALYREALVAVLGVAGERDLGLEPSHPRPALPADMARPMSVVAASTRLLEVMAPTPQPVRIGRPEIEQIWRAAAAFSMWDNLYGGLAREAPLAQLRWSADLIQGTACPAELRPDLLSAVGYLAHTCAFMAFDGYAFDDARRLLSFGVLCAEEADNWHLRARLLATRVRVDTWVGDPDRGLTHAQVALVRSERLTATERAMLHSLEARALACLHRREATMEAIGRADDAFASRSAAEDPPWMGFYDDAQHAGDIGVALLDLALAHLVDESGARSRLETAIKSRRPDLPRSRALSQVGLAKLTMARGDPAEAVSLGCAALDTAGPIRSRRVSDDLAQLDCLAAQHTDRDDVVELRERLRLAAPG
jgi:hypothetical protein